MKKSTLLITVILVVVMSLSLVLVGCNSAVDKEGTWAGVDKSNLAEITSTIRAKASIANFSLSATEVKDGKSSSTTICNTVSAVYEKQNAGEKVKESIVAREKGVDIRYERAEGDTRWLFVETMKDSTNTAVQMNIDYVNATIDEFIAMQPTFDDKELKWVVASGEKTGEMTFCENGVKIMMKNGTNSADISIYDFGLTIVVRPPDSEIDKGYWQDADRTHLKELIGKFEPDINAGNYTIKEYGDSDRDSYIYKVTDKAIERVTIKDGQPVKYDIYAKASEGNESVHYSKLAGATKWSLESNYAYDYDYVENSIKNLALSIIDDINSGVFIYDDYDKAFLNANVDKAVSSVNIVYNGLVADVNLSNMESMTGIRDEKYPFHRHFAFKGVGVTEVSVPTDNDINKAFGDIDTTKLSEVMNALKANIATNYSMNFVMGTEDIYSTIFIKVDNDNIERLDVSKNGNMVRTDNMLMFKNDNGYCAYEKEDNAILWNKYDRSSAIGYMPIRENINNTINELAALSSDEYTYENGVFKPKDETFPVSASDLIEIVVSDSEVIFKSKTYEEGQKEILVFNNFNSIRLDEPTVDEIAPLWYAVDYTSWRNVVAYLQSSFSLDGRSITIEDTMSDENATHIVKVSGDMVYVEHSTDNIDILVRESSKIMHYKKTPNTAWLAQEADEEIFANAFRTTIGNYANVIDESTNWMWEYNAVNKEYRLIGNSSREFERAKFVDGGIKLYNEYRTDKYIYIHDIGTTTSVDVHKDNVEYNPIVDIHGILEGVDKSNYENVLKVIVEKISNKGEIVYKLTSNDDPSIYEVLKIRNNVFNIINVDGNKYQEVVCDQRNEEGVVYTREDSTALWKASFDLEGAPTITELMTLVVNEFGTIDATKYDYDKDSRTYILKIGTTDSVKSITLLTDGLRILRTNADGKDETVEITDIGEYVDIHVPYRRELVNPEVFIWDNADYDDIDKIISKLEIFSDKNNYKMKVVANDGEMFLYADGNKEYATDSSREEYCVHDVTTGKYIKITKNAGDTAWTTTEITKEDFDGSTKQLANFVTSIKQMSWSGYNGDYYSNFQDMEVRLNLTSDGFKLSMYNYRMGAIEYVVSGIGTTTVELPTV